MESVVEHVYVCVDRGQRSTGIGMNTALCHTEGSPRVQVESGRGNRLNGVHLRSLMERSAPSGHLVAAAPGPGRIGATAA